MQHVTMFVYIIYIIYIYYIYYTLYMYVYTDELMGSFNYLFFSSPARLAYAILLQVESTGQI